MENDWRLHYTPDERRLPIDASAHALLRAYPGDPAAAEADGQGRGPWVRPDPPFLLSQEGLSEYACTYADCADDVCYGSLVRKHQGESAMSRLTITLSEARYKALKEAAAQRGRTIGQLVEESLEFYGIKSREDARDLVRRARERSGLSEDDATALAVEQAKHVRRGA